MKEKLQKLIKEAILSLNLGKDETILVEFPKDEKLGDYSTNVALVLAKKIGKNPLEIAENIKAKIEKLPEIEKIEIAKPGFINFYLSQKYFQDLVEKINVEKENFGNSQIGKGIKINNEFISANPTGPLHLGNGRGGFFGDALSRILRKSGFEVENEYYVNDAGEQILKLGHSVLKDAEAVYEGDYIDQIKFEENQSVDIVGAKAAEIILNEIIKPTILEKMQIEIDSYIHEKDLAKDIDKALEILKEKKLTFQEDGALWFQSTKFGDDKDRVLVKQDGQRTYLASDCGYILDKKERGFEKIIETWGADHHGYINRFRAVAEAFGFEKENIKFNIVQLVRLMKDGQEVRMSKRAGNVVYIDELIEKVGHDVVRFFFLMYSPDTHMNFDLGLAEEQSQKNPVFYVQYAYARICSILGKAEVDPSTSSGQAHQKANLSLLKDEKEVGLIKELNKFPELVEEIGENYNVQKLPQYVIKIADKFHSFYNACQVIDEENQELTKARLKLILAVKIVLGETLNLIGVRAPEKM